MMRSLEKLGIVIKRIDEEVVVEDLLERLNERGGELLRFRSFVVVKRAIKEIDSKRRS